MQSSSSGSIPMSRHRDVRNLDYDELLDDEAATNEMSREESDRLDAAVEAITNRIGDSFSLKEVQDSAWYYYFDVDQATNWLLGAYSLPNEDFLY